MSANLPKHDAWPEPTRWFHCWVKFDHSNPAPMPGLVLDWQPIGGKMKAWVIWLDTRAEGVQRRQGWLGPEVLRPVKSDINVWNRQRRG